MSSPLGAVETVRVFKEAALPVRVRLIRWPHPGRADDWKRIRNRRVTKLTYISGTKYVVDGTPIEQWALMKEEYPGRPGWHGRLYYTEDQMMLHVVGDKATEIVLREMKELAPESTWRSRRLRIEHAPGVTGPNIELARRLGVVLTQPRVDGVQMGAWVRAGIPLAHGSDGEGGNPWSDFRSASSGAGARATCRRRSAAATSCRCGPPARSNRATAARRSGAARRRAAAASARRHARPPS